MAKDHGITDFKASNGWLQFFRKRRVIKCSRLQGEAADVDMEAVSEWQMNGLRLSLAPYAPRDVYNADEFALFYQLQPNRTMTMNGNFLHFFCNCTSEIYEQKAIGWRNSKLRISILACANMVGEKRPLLSIGKYKSPRCFKGQNIPVAYRSNKAAWMTRTCLFLLIFCSTIFRGHLHRVATRVG